MLNQHADDLDNAIDELGRQLDHLRQVGIRGFIAEHSNDDDYATATRAADQRTSGGTKKKAPSKKTRSKT